MVEIASCDRRQQTLLDIFTGGTELYFVPIACISFFQLQYRLVMCREGTHACNFVAVFMGQLLLGEFLASLTLNVTYKREESLGNVGSPHWKKGKTKYVLFLRF